MTTCDFTLALFCRVDDALQDAPKHPLSLLYPSEVVTLGMLHALRGGGNRAFYRWVEREMKTLFPRLPERTRLFRAFEQHAAHTQHFLAQPTFFGVVDSLGIELLHPWRFGRSPHQIGRKSYSNHRWIVGAKLALVCNRFGQVVSWTCAQASVHDSHFHPLLLPFEKQMIVLGDQGFFLKAHQPPNLKVCPRGGWNERMTIETVFSLLTGVLKIKKLSNRRWPALSARLAYVVAVFNLCIVWSGQVKLQLAPFAL